MEKNEMIRRLQEIADHCKTNSFASFGLEEGPLWQSPMVGFARGDDPLFRQFKEDIGEPYWTPDQAFRLKYSEDAAEDKDLSVISLAFSQVPETMEEQRKETTHPSRRWRISRNRWNAFTRELYVEIEKALEEAGIPVAIPDRLPGMGIRKSEKYVYASPWSQRHAAMAAGQGTFGLSEGLITKQGVAMRFATFIVKERFAPDEREYESFRDWCSFYRDGSCGACIKRCPAGAITPEGHDKKACSEYLEKMQEAYADDAPLDPKEEMGCGLCQSRVPCATGLPNPDSAPPKRL